MNIGVILAAGDGKRFRSVRPKQFLKLNGKEIVYYSIAEMRKTSVIDKIYLVVNEEEYRSGYISQKYGVDCIEGASTRNRSIYNAILFLTEKYGGRDVNVLFHDSVRPFVKAEQFEEYFSLANNYDCVAACKEVSDSLCVNDGAFVDRSLYKLIQTPEVASLEFLKVNFDPDSEATAIIHQLYDKCKTCLKVENSFNMKITFPEELFLAEQFVKINYQNCDRCYTTADISTLKSVLLFGASGGIGGVLKQYFEKNGVVCLSPSRRDLDMKTITADAIKNYVGERTPDAIINAAACYYDDNDGLTQAFDEIFAVNVKANLAIIEYAANEARKKTNLIFFSSSSSTMGRKNLTDYSASKAALNSIVESQAEILAKRNIFLNAIVPEKVKTPLIEKLHKMPIDDRELLSPDEILDVVAYFSVCEDYGKLMHVRKGL